MSTVKDLPINFHFVGEYLVLRDFFSLLMCFLILTFFFLQSVPLSALELGLETEATAAVKQEPETVSSPALLNVRVRTDTWGFCVCGVTPS